ncbi:single-stranded DNA-binding protein [Anaerovibrio sp. RM50]|uniref:single-stranded DNA-binding protein n=1 Tax=Anaerovibrio sp. RM50 TaxID=1200557 RepID=UPI0005646D46|nr:single-stranded DNA-binding protein [Anaerovibrio sp. RM50]
MNKVTLHGRLARDPEVRYTTSGKAVASVSIAVNRRGKEHDKADFIPLIFWDKLAENVGNFCGKGKELLVEGRIQVRSYDAQDGSKKYVTEVVVNEMEFCGTKNDAGSQNNSSHDNSTGNNVNEPFGGKPVSDDDIPF